MSLVVEPNRSPSRLPTDKTRWSESTVMAYATATMIAAAFCAWFFPASFVLGDGGFFQWPDASQHVSGWLLFAQDRWRLPLLVTRRIAPPDGLAIFLTDSIPLAALALKPFAGWLPDGFHYFGIWHVLLRFGQAIGITFLLRGLGARTIVAALAGSIFALFWPALIARTGHTALATHALVLFALGFYARARLRNWPDRRSYGAFATLAVIALMIHPYLLAMVLSVVCAFTIDRLWHGPRRAAASIGLGATALVVLLVILPTGYLSNGPSGIGGFSLYSMNMLSVICGGDLSPCGLMNMDGGQYEGFNNLGMGLIVLIPVALWLGRKEIVPIMREAPGVPILALGLTLFALSNKIWFGPYLLVEYPVPALVEPITEVFRAPGRFFWPVGYMILAAAIAVVTRHSARIWVAALLLLATVLQVADVRTSIAVAQSEIRRADVYDFTRWKLALDGKTQIQVFPRYGCVAMPDGPYAFLQLLAGEIGATTSTAYQPRPSQDCNGVLAENPPAPGADTLLVSLAEQAGLPQPASVREAMAAGQCALVPAAETRLLICSANPSVDWTALGLPVEPAR